MARAIGGIIVGLVVAIVAMLAIGAVGDMLYRLPADVDARDAQAVGAAFQTSPLGAKLMLILTWLGAGLAGGAVARLIARQRGVEWVLALIVAALAVVMVFAVALPAWMQVATVIAPFVGAAIAHHLIAVPARPDVEAEDGAV